MPDRNPPDAATVVGESITTAPYRYQATIAFPTTRAEQLAGRIPPTVGVVRSDGDGCLLTTGADHLEALAGHLVGLGLDFEVREPPELRRHLRHVASRLRRATNPPSGA